MSSLSDHAAKLANLLYLLTLVFLPTQLGRHFFIAESYVLGIRIDYLAPTLYITDILIFLLFLCVFISRIYYFRFVQPSPLFIFGGFLVMTSFLFHILTGSQISTVYAFIKLLEMSFLCWYTYYYWRSHQNLSLFVLAFFIGMTFESSLGILQFVKQESVNTFYLFGERTFTASTPGIANASIHGELILRPYGTLPHPNVLAGYLLLGILIVWSRKDHLSNSLRRVLYLITILSTVAVVFSLSRLVIVLCLVASISYMIRRRFVLPSLSQLIYGSLFSIGLFFMTFEYLSPRFLQLFEVTESVTRRLDLARYSLQMINDAPLFGVGPMQFLHMLPPHLPLRADVFFLQPVHNIFLLVLAELGLTGGVGVLLTIISLIKEANNRLTLFSFTIGGVVCFIGMFDHYFLTLQQGQMLLAVCVGIILSDRRKRISPARLGKI